MLMASYKSAILQSHTCIAVYALAVFYAKRPFVYTTFTIFILAQYTRNKLVHHTLTAMTRHSAETASSAPKRPSAQRVSAETAAPKCPAPCIRDICVYRGRGFRGWAIECLHIENSKNYKR